MTTTTWRAARDIEAVLYVVKNQSTLVQLEVSYPAAYDTYLTRQEKARLAESADLPCVDLTTIGASARFIRIGVPHDQLTLIGQQAKGRALEEAQRRFPEELEDEQLLDIALDTSV